MNPTRKQFSMVVWASLLTTAAFHASATPTSPAAGPDKAYTGTVSAVDFNENTLEAKSFLFGKKFNLGSACAYSFLDETNGAETGLHVGQKVTVNYQDVDGVLVADRVEQQPMRYEGRVKSVDTTNRTITVHEEGLGLDKQFQFAAGCRVVLRDDRSGALNDIQPGNYVSLLYETPPGMPTVQTISQTSEKFTGTLTAIDLDQRTVKAKSLFSEMKFSLGDNCVIAANGKADGQMSDLKPDDKLVFTYDEINGVNVVNHIAPAKDAEKTVAENHSSAGD